MQNLNDEHIKILVERNKDLEELELSHNQNLTDESPISMINHLNKLVKLSMRFTKTNLDNPGTTLDLDGEAFEIFWKI